MVPIRNEYGVVVAFGGRILEIFPTNGDAEKGGPPSTAAAAGGEINEDDPTNLAKMAAAAAAAEKAQAPVAKAPPAGNNAGAAAKYLNSPESTLFKKGSTLFGLDVAKQAIAARKEAIVVEVRVVGVVCDVARVEHQVDLLHDAMPLSAFSLPHSGVL